MSRERKEKDDEPRRGLARGLKQLFLRASLGLSVLSHKLRQFAEEALSSDEVVNELFMVTSSSSVSPSLLEQPSPIPEDTTSQTATTAQAGLSEEPGAQSEEATLLWSDFDSVGEAEKLRVDDVPFSSGSSVWERRRAAWTRGTRQERLVAKQRAVDGALAVPRENFPVIYASLVERNRTLKKPMNLKDALRVINAGWLANKKWERASQGLA